MAEHIRKRLQIRKVLDVDRRGQVPKGIRHDPRSLEPSQEANLCATRSFNGGEAFRGGGPNLPQFRGFLPGAPPLLSPAIKTTPSSSPAARFLRPRQRNRSPQRSSSSCENRNTGSTRSVKHPGRANGPLSPTAVRKVLKKEGFAPLPRRPDQERPAAIFHPRTDPTQSRYRSALGLGPVVSLAAMVVRIGSVFFRGNL